MSASARRSFWPNILARSIALMSASEEELQQVNEIGPRVSAAIREFFDEPKNVALVERLREGRAEFHRPEEAARDGTGRERHLC